MANSISPIKTVLATAAPLGICAQLLLSSAAPAQAQVRFTMLNNPVNAAWLKANSGTVLNMINGQATAPDNADWLKANSGAILNAIKSQGTIHNNATPALNPESAANERIRMAEIAAQREDAQLQAQQAQQDSQTQQTQAWIQLGMGLLGGLLQPRPQPEPVAPSLTWPNCSN